MLGIGDPAGIDPIGFKLDGGTDWPRWIGIPSKRGQQPGPGDTRRQGQRQQGKGATHLTAPCAPR